MKPDASFSWRRWLLAGTGAIACLVMVQIACAELAYQIVVPAVPASRLGTFWGLVQARDGMFYGTSSAKPTDPGTLFQLTSGGSLNMIIVQFTGANGRDPEGGLLLANDGNLYGTTYSGGSNDLGTIFRFNTSTGLRTLHSFNATEGSHPMYQLMQASNGLLYGVTTGSSTNRGATIFQATTNGDVTVLTKLNDNSLLPNDGLVEGPDGWFYGTTTSLFVPATVLGSIYKVSTNGDFQTLVRFNSSGTYSPPSNCPAAGLTLAADGYLYGTLAPPSSYLGTTNGSIFRMTTQGAMNTVATFNGTNGASPATRLLLASDGSFYGMTSKTVFRATPSGELAAVAHFYGTNGSGPSMSQGAPPLIQSRDGCIYGTSFARVGLPPGTNAPLVFRLVETPVITVTRQPPSRITLTWNSFTTGVYQVYYKTNLLATNWIWVFPPIGATGPTCSYSESTAYVDQRYYKVVLWP